MQKTIGTSPNAPTRLRKKFCVHPHISHAFMRVAKAEGISQNALLERCILEALDVFALENLYLHTHREIFLANLSKGEKMET